jgi:methionine synthase II (cobalamin-independent)
MPANNLNDDEIINLKNLDVMFEFSYFFISKATQIPLTHVDSEKHTINKLEINKLKEFIKIVSCEKVILSSDCGVSVLPKPHLGFKNFISLIKDLGFSTNDIKKMISTNSKNLFNI